MNESIKVLLKRLGIVLVILFAASLVIVALTRVYTDQLGSMVFACLIGGFGAGVSLIKRIPALAEDKLFSLTASWWNLVTPVLVGVIMGGVLYIVFFAGILTGDGGNGLFTSNLFPNFTYPHTNDSEAPLLDIRGVLAIRPASIQDFGKLLVWCFLSGYSERFVPSLLASLEKKAIDK